jgi:hypothetical protein
MSQNSDVVPVSSFNADFANDKFAARFPFTTSANASTYTFTFTKSLKPDSRVSRRTRQWAIGSGGRLAPSAWREG